MGKIVTLQIQNQKHELIVKEYKGQRVITFKDIDKVHGRPEGTAGRNFRENRDKFIQDEDYFYLSGEELAVYKQTTNFVGSNAKELILITESGYLMLTKSLNDDLAWQIQRQLVKTYFRAKEITKITTPTVYMYGISRHTVPNKFQHGGITKPARKKLKNYSAKKVI